MLEGFWANDRQNQEHDRKPGRARVFWLLALLVPVVLVLVWQPVSRMLMDRSIEDLVEGQAVDQGLSAPRVLEIRHEGLGRFGHCDHELDNDEGLALVWWSGVNEDGDRSVRLDTVAADGRWPLFSGWRTRESHLDVLQTNPAYADPHAQVSGC